MYKMAESIEKYIQGLEYFEFPNFEQIDKIKENVPKDASNELDKMCSRISEIFKGI